jgi:TRAP-type mannitol/chloroaromatic compound transport system substrate-binding protein
MSNRAALTAVVVAFLVGVIGSLAIRPPSGAAPTTDATTAAAGEARVRWRVPVSFGTNWPVLGDNFLFVADLIERASGGGIQLKAYEPGEIVPAFSIVDAVRERKTQAGFTWLGYDQGKMPWSALIAAVPFGMEPWEYMAWWYAAGGRELAMELYEPLGVRPVLCGLISPETAGWFRKPINNLSDIEGLKIRFAGLGGKVLERLGASVTMIPGSEIFQALEKGAIDATEYSLPIVDQMLGFDRVARINYYPGWHQTFTATHLVVNLNDWNALAPADKSTIESGCQAGVAQNLARAEGLQAPVIADLAKRGVTVSRLSIDILEELARVTEEVMEEEAAADAKFARVLASQRAFRESYQVWKELAYLPRDF